MRRPETDPRYSAGHIEEALAVLEREGRDAPLEAGSRPPGQKRGPKVRTTPP